MVLNQPKIQALNQFFMTHPQHSPKNNGIKNFVLALIKIKSETSKKHVNGHYKHYIRLTINISYTIIKMKYTLYF